MLPLAPSRRARGVGVSRTHRGSRSAPVLESLETRQLLTASLALGSLSQLTGQTNLTVLPMASTGPSGYTPTQIQTAYGVNQISLSGAVSGTGAGQTIAIIDAYSDPTIAADLAKFDAQFGLSAPPSFVVKNLGATTTNAGWALETSLDVEWAHALAPKANIVLVEAASSSLTSLFGAVSSASQMPGVSVVSMSWGTPEFWGEWSLDGIFTTPAGHTSITYVASSGDSGAWSGPMYPSVSPNVLAVGGTSLTLGAKNTYGSETGWSGSTGGFSGTDNGFYFYETAPASQVAAQAAVGLNYGVRTTPDVSFNADPNTGVAVYDSTAYSGQSGWFQVGGTSAAAPAWAGLVAIADQGLAAAGKGTLSTTQLSTELYNLPSTDFHDITSGFNGYSATPGYDLVTGLGSPKANMVVSGILAANGVSTGVVKSTAIVIVTVVSSTHEYIVSVGPTSGPGATASSVGASSTASIGAAPAASGPATSTVSITTTAGAAASTGQATASSSSGTSSSSPSALAAQATALAASASPASSTAVGQGPATSFDANRLAREKTALSDLILETTESSGGIVHESTAQPSSPSSDAPVPAMPMAPPLPALPDAAIPGQSGEKQKTDGAPPPAPPRPAPARPEDDEANPEPGTLSGLVVILGASALALREHRKTRSAGGRDRRSWLPGRISSW